MVKPARLTIGVHGLDLPVMTDTKLYDKRTAARHILRGAISKADYERFNADLKDVSDNMDVVTIKIEDEDDTSEETTE